MLEENLKARTELNLDITVSGSGEKLARYLVEGPDPDLADKLAYEPRTTFVLYGLGDGSLATAISERLDSECALIVVELDNLRLETALSLFDLRKLLGHQCVKLIGPQQDLFVWLYHRILRAGKVQVLVPQGLLERDDRYRELHENKVLYLLRLLASSAQTTRVLGSQILTNLARSAFLCGADAGVNCLTGAFKGVPCVLIGSGPSLNGSEDSLLSLVRTAVLIASDSTLGWLLDRGIVPDFVVSVDPQEITFTCYDGIDIPKSVSLVYNPMCHWKIPRNFLGLRFVTEVSAVPFEVFSHYWSPKGTLEDSANCQLMLGFNLARLIGASEIAFIGNDLSYPTGKFCASGGRGYMADYYDFDITTDSVEVENIVGEKVLTTPLFLSYRDIFGWLVEQFGRLCFQTSLNGLSIRGVSNVSVQSVVERWGGAEAGNKFKVIQSAHGSYINWFDQSGLTKYILKLKRRLIELTERAARRDNLDDFYQEICLLPVELGNYDQLSALAFQFCEALNDGR